MSTPLFMAAYLLAVNDVCGALLTAGPRLFAVMGLALSAITLTFLVCIWLLRMMRAAMPV